MWSAQMSWLLGHASDLTDSELDTVWYISLIDEAKLPRACCWSGLRRDSQDSVTLFPVAYVEYEVQSKLPIPGSSCRFLSLISQSNGKGPPTTSVVHFSGCGQTVSPLSSTAGPTVRRFPHITNNSASAKIYPGHTRFSLPKMWCSFRRG